jgi:uncharacterized membrane protein
VRDNFTVFALLYLFPLIIGLSNGTWVVDSRRSWHNDVPVATNTLGNSTLPAWAWGGLGIAFIFALLIGVLLKIMIQQGQLQASSGHRLSLSELFKVARASYWQMFGLYLLVGLVTLIGFILFIIPGIIMLRRYFLAPYVLLENKGMGIWGAMEESAKITRRDSWSIYSIFGVMILFTLFGVLPLIGWIIAFGLHFFYTVAPALRYQELKRLS